MGAPLLSLLVAAMFPSPTLLDRRGAPVLLALADGQAPTGTRVADEHRIARSTLQDALERLLADERNAPRNDRDRRFVLDPLVGEWLRRR